MVTVVNDRAEPVKVIPCGRYDCGYQSAVRLSRGRQHVWHSHDNDHGVQSFFVYDSGGRQLGCLGQTDRAGKHTFYLTSALDECVT